MSRLMLTISDQLWLFISNKLIQIFILERANLFETQWITFKLALCRMPSAAASPNRIKSIWASTVWCLKGCNSAKQFHYQIGGGMSMCCISLAPAFTSPNIKWIKSLALRLICRDRSECHPGQTKLNSAKCTKWNFPLTSLGFV